MSEDSKEIRTLRMMAWERAKGELRSMLATFWEGTPDRHDCLRKEIDKFITAVEDDGLHE